MPQYIFNPLEGEFDAIENDFGTEGIYLTDTDGVQWQLTVNTDGSLQTTVVTGGGGDVIPLFFFLLPNG